MFIFFACFILKECNLLFRPMFQNVFLMSYIQIMKELVLLWDKQYTEVTYILKGGIKESHRQNCLTKKRVIDSSPQQIKFCDKGCA